MSRVCATPSKPFHSSWRHPVARMVPDFDLPTSSWHPPLLDDHPLVNLVLATGCLEVSFSLGLVTTVHVQDVGCYQTTPAVDVTSHRSPMMDRVTPHFQTPPWAAWIILDVFCYPPSGVEFVKLATQR